MKTYPILAYVRESDFAVRTPWDSPPRRLLDYLLIYIQQGCCIVTVEGKEHIFKSGEFCLIQPNDIHTLEGTTNTITPFVHMDVFYNSNRENSFPTIPGQVDLSHLHHLLQPRLNDFPGIHVPVRLSLSQPSRFKELMLKIVGMFQLPDAFSRMETHHLATGLIINILKDHLQTKTVPLSPTPDLLNWITSYLSFNLSRPISVQDMARTAGLSPSHFSAEFRKQLGLPPYQYLIHLRVQHAQELLQHSEHSLNEVAEQCGFADVHHFSKVFTRVTGQSPGTFRNGVRDTVYFQL